MHLSTIVRPGVSSPRLTHHRCRSQDPSTLVSDSASVKLRSVVEFDVKATLSTGDAFIASETLTLDTSSVSGRWRAADTRPVAG